MEVCYLLIPSLCTSPFYASIVLNRYLIGTIKLVTAALRWRSDDHAHNGWPVHESAHVLGLLTANGNGIPSEFWISKSNAPNELDDVQRVSG